MQKSGNFVTETPPTPVVLGEPRGVSPCFSSVLSRWLFYKALARDFLRLTLAHSAIRIELVIVITLVHKNRCRKQSLQQPLEKQEMASFASPLQPLSNGATSIAADEELLYTLDDVAITAAPQSRATARRARAGCWTSRARALGSSPPRGL